MIELCRRVRSTCCGAVVCVALISLAAPAEAQPPSDRRLTELSLEELAELEVTSVSRYAEALSAAPASIFVITADDIRRSGATSLAEALRLAPNLLVARLDASQYAVSARGFNNLVANKLLVLIDGRTIYTPLFSGVFWDQQDVLLEDVDRIEVISGPGATLWGANAVNGVINITTKSSRDTRGTLVSAGGGNQEQLAAVRYGGALGDRGRFRVYGKVVHLENTETAAEVPVIDSRRWLQAGFRADWGEQANGLTIQGDAYDGESADRGSVLTFNLGRVELSGMNLLARLVRRQSERSDFQIQAYVDRYTREERVFFQPEAHLFDLEFQHGIRLNRHRAVWGAGYRRGSDEVQDGILLAFRPTERVLNWENVFVHDEIRLTEALAVSAGLKLERNDYTGWEYLPSTRLAWKPSVDHFVWAAASRAVRAPARLDRDIITPQGTVLGGPNFVSEVANVFELGYRGQPISVLTMSVTAFRHDWDNVRSGTALPVFIENRIEGPVYGVEAWASWQATGSWRLSGGLLAFEKGLRLEPGSTDPVGTSNPQLANDPGHQWMLRSSFGFWTSHQLDAIVRQVGELPNPSVPGYTALNLRYAWRARPDLELSVKAQDVLDSHVEFGAAPGRSEFTPGIFLQALWSR